MTSLLEVSLEHRGCVGRVDLFFLLGDGRAADDHQAELLGHQQKSLGMFRLLVKDFCGELVKITSSKRDPKR